MQSPSNSDIPLSQSSSTKPISKAARDFSKYETLPPEQLERLRVQMSEYDAQFADVEESKRPSKSKRKAQEKIYRTALEKEYKSSQKKVAGASGEGSVTVEEKAVQQQVVHLVKPDIIAIEIYSDEVRTHIGQRVKLNGWVNHIRFSGKQLCFIDLRDSIGVLQCVGGAGIADSEEVIVLTRETCISVYGKLKVTKRRKVEKDEVNEIVELDMDFLEVIGVCPVEYTSLLNEDSEVGQRLEQRHLLLRGLKTRAIMRVRSQLLMEIRRYLYSHRFEEVSPPTLVKNSCEGGCKMFKVKYYNQDAFLTESSQLYLETALPALGNVFCVLPSYRAEESLTRRHLAEFTHFEAEMPFYTFEKLLDFVEDLVVNVIGNVVESCKEQLTILDSTIIKTGPPKKPFIRIKHSDAIKKLQSEGTINHKTSEPFKDGEDIPEKNERQFVEDIGAPVLLTHFPAQLKAFYMQPAVDVKADSQLTENSEGGINKRRNAETESVDLLMPGVGEVMGGSMRIYDLGYLLQRYNDEGMDPQSMYWYNDLRKYGSCPHGGFGFGVERIVCWLCSIDHIRDACLFPRYMGVITP